jgi:simple sugar transport system ATP-binding protein
MVAEGRGVIFITHKLDEVMAVADRVTVLRRARNVTTVDRAATTPRELARAMIGGTLEQGAPLPSGPAGGEVVLGLEGLAADDDRGLPALRGIDLELRAGEIVGIAGVAGNGQRELAETVVGLRPARAGKVLLRGRDVTAWPVARRIAAGIGYAPEDRLRHGLAPTLSLLDNLTAKSYRSAPVGGRFLVRRGEARRAAAELLRRFDVRGAELDAPAATLSGGNMQKLVLARELSADPWLLVAAQPTRGLDLGAAEATRRLLLEQRAAGKALLVSSEDLEELLALSDRLVVLYQGRIMATFAADEADEERIGLLMAGREA